MGLFIWLCGSFLFGFYSFLLERRQETCFIELAELVFVVSRRACAAHFLLEFLCFVSGHPFGLSQIFAWAVVTREVFWAGHRPRSELGRAGHFFINPETWPSSPVSPWFTDKQNFCAPLSVLFFLVPGLASLSKFSLDENTFIAKVKNKKPSGAQSDPE